MTSDAKTVEEYIATLPEDRKAAISAVREVILQNLPEGYQERMQYGMIGYSVPHDIYPAGYHCDPKQPLPFASLASQKNYMSVYLPGVYTDESEATVFVEEYKASGKKLDMGKACVRFKKLDDLPLEVVGRQIARWPVDRFVERYEALKAEYGLGKRKK